MRVDQFVESYMDAWNHRDAEAVAEHLARDGVYCDVPENVQRSRDELIVSLKGFFSEFRHRYELIGEILAGQDTIAFQYRMYPSRKMNQAGMVESFNGAEFMTLNGDAAMIIMDYYDIPGIARPTHLARSHPAEDGKYAKSGLSQQQLLCYKQRLQHLMENDQLYLRSDLTLPRLAEELDCSVNHLSQVINSGFGTSFFGYLNRYRIEHAKELLAELDGHNGAVLNIAYSVGFNSNSAFYAAFKKFVGKTPAQYRRAKQK